MSAKAKGKGAKSAKPRKAGPYIVHGGGRVIHGGRATDVQSVTFDKQYWDARRAKSWLRERGFKSPKVDETTGQLRFRQRAPGQYSEYATKKISPTINLVLGIRPGAKKKEPAKAKGKAKAKGAGRKR
jgi:hypothetical protein